MKDRTAEYFAGPARQRACLLPRGFSATVRLDLGRPGRTAHWYLTLNEGDIFCEASSREADCVISADGDVFDRLVAGGDPTTATLRNEITYSGPPITMIYFERLLPGPPGSHGPARVTDGDGEERGR